MPSLRVERNLVGTCGTVREGERILRLGKKPRMQRGLLFLLAGAALFCLGILLPLLATTAYEVPSAAARVDVGHVDKEALAPLAEDGSHPLTPAEEAQETDERPLNASVLTMLVLAVASFGGSILWLTTTSAQRQQAIRPCWGAEGNRRWSAGTHEGLSSLGVFLL
jgi:hypothetical protein